MQKEYGQNLKINAAVNNLNDNYEIFMSHLSCRGIKTKDRSRGFKTVCMFISAEHGIFFAHVGILLS